MLKHSNWTKKRDQTNRGFCREEPWVRALHALAETLRAYETRFMIPAWGCITHDHLLILFGFYYKKISKL